MLSDKNPQVKHAVGKLMELSTDERERLLAESREKLRGIMDDVTEGAEAKGRAKALLDTARRMLAAGRPLEEIVQFTGLAIDDIRALMH